MKKLLALSLIFTLLLASCGNVGDSSDTDDAVITESPTDTTDIAPTMDDYVNGELPLPAIDKLHLLGDRLSFYPFDNGNCTVVYDEHGAWIFDYTEQTVTPTVDIEKMIARVDPTGRADKHFTDATIAYEFEENETYLIIHYTVTAKDDPESRFEVTSSYNKSAKRSHSGYNFTSVKYPGHDEPIIMSSFEEFEAYNAQTNVYYEDNFIDTFKLMLANDTAGLEKQLHLTEGILSSWKGTVIGDYTIIREMPIMDYTKMLAVEFTIEKSTVQLCPEGRYRLSNGGIRESLYKLERLDEVKTDEPAWSKEKTDAVKWALAWGKDYGGAYTAEEQDIENEPLEWGGGFPHSVYDYFISQIVPAVTGDEALKWSNISGNTYREYAEKYLNLKDFDNSYTAYGDEIISHGGHDSGWPLRADVTDYTFEDGIHYVTITYYADPFCSVAARIHRFAMVEADHGIYALHHTDFLYDSGFPVDTLSA